MGSETLQRENAEQKLTINELLRRAFEKRRERYLENPDQLRLDFGDAPEAESLAEAVVEAANASAEIVVPEHTRRVHPPRKPRNEQLPAHLPRYEVTLPVSDETKTCATHGEKTLIGHDRQETLEFERPKLKVRVTLIPKFACVKSPRSRSVECGVTEAARPEGLVEGNRYDTSVEDRARGLTPAERQTLRESDSQPLWNRLRELLDGDLAKRVLPKEKIAEALGDLRNHWDALRRHLTDGRVPIDNNDVEQLLKQVAIGRKNWLFLGSVPAGERAANFLTLVSSALRNDLDVYAYLKAVLDSLLSGSTDDATLRPDQWATEHPEAIRQYRREERRDRDDRKTARRAERRTPIRKNRKLLATGPDGHSLKS